MTTFRPATPDDAGAVIAVRIASWNAAYAHHLPDDAWADYDVEAATRRLAGSIVLWVLEDNSRARRFHERAGFAPDGARKDAEMPGGPVPRSGTGAAQSTARAS